MEVTEDNLIEAGYYKHSHSGVHQYADALFQKRIQDGKRTMYFVNIDQYLPHGDGPLGWGWLPSVQFSIPNDRIVNIKLSGEQSIEDIEATFAKAFADFGALAYDESEG